MDDTTPQAATESELPAAAVAIVGMAVRLPGADRGTTTVATFWQNLIDGRESITRFAPAELEDSFDAETRARPEFVAARPILRDIDQFDAEFFGLHARDAALTDPQARVLLECAWEAFEHAGIVPGPERLTGVYAGTSISSYLIRHVLGDTERARAFTAGYQVSQYPELLGSGHDFTATRIAYRLDLRGPAINLNSACSTSLLAVAQACQSLLLYQCDQALAGGASISLPQARGYLHVEGSLASADGHCRSFDADASGTVFGSGAGLVLLKRLEDAIADGDTIHAVILGCGVNNDGADKAGFTAPSVDGQAACIEQAHAQAGVDPRTISYVECHGTATPVGDPIEIAALTRAFRRATADTGFCRIGSVKSNIGHVDAAAGVSGLVKTALALRHRRLPATLHYRRPNPQIDFATTPFVVNAECRDWTCDGPRRAGVSAFGVGGTNVHLVLEAPPPAPPRGAEPIPPQLFVLSARSPAALAARREDLAAHLREHPDDRLDDLAWTLATGRKTFEHAACFVAASHGQALTRLEGGEPARVASGRRPATPSPVVFLFPGQGAQYPDMGRALYETEPVFRAAVDACADALVPKLGGDLRTLLYPAADPAAAAKRLMNTLIAQPAIFTVEYALARLWLARGVEPVAMVGHSVGEFVAATIAGVFRLDDALAIVAERGRLMAALPGGAMLSVRLPEAEVRPRLTPALALAAINGPSLCVVSGPFADIEALETRLAADGITHRRLHTSHAFHSAMVEPIVAPLREVIAGLRLAAPTIPFASCVTGRWIDAAEATAADYWAGHARAPVRFADALTTAIAGRSPLLLELGPGSVLTTLAAQIAKGRGLALVPSLPDADQAAAAAETLLAAQGRLWLAGHPLPPALWAASTPRRLPLPTYPFQRSRHWIEPPAAAASLPVPVPAPVIAAAPAAVEPAPNSLSFPSFPMSPAQDLPVSDATTAAAHRDRLRAQVIRVLEDLSGEPPPTDDPATSFLEMGYDSLFLTQVAQRLGGQLKLKLSFRQLLNDTPTIDTLAAFLADAVPAPAAPAAAPAAAAAMPQSAAVSMPGLGVSAPAGSAIEAVFRDQLAAMSALIGQQMAALGALGLGPPAAAAAPASLPAPAPDSNRAATPAAAERDDAPDNRPQRINLYRPTAVRASDSGFTPEQDRYIAELCRRYSTRLAASKAATQASRAVLADPRAVSGFRAEWKEMVFPIVCTESKGARIRDLDGHDYIDLVNGYGQTMFGHTPPFVADAVKAQLDRGFAIGPQADLAGDVAARFAAMTGHERVTFCNTGSEAVMAAMRVARSVTGRAKVVVFNGDYHGQFDEVLVKGVQKAGKPPRSRPIANGIPDESVANMVVLDYGTAESLDWIRANADELAAVVVEPIQSRHPALFPLDYLRELRAITAASGTAFVIDEVVTGFRVHPGGVQRLVGLDADLATYGKVVGGGLPVGILAGKAAFMDGLDGGHWQYGDDSCPPVGVTFFAGTFVRHPLVLAAVQAVLAHLEAEGEALQQRLTARCVGLVERLNALFAEFGLVTRIETFSSWFYFNLHAEHPLATLLFHGLRLRGIHIQDGFPCFLTTAHSDDDLDRIVAAFRETLAELSAVGVFGSTATAVPAAASPAANAPLAIPTAEARAPARSGLPPTEPQVEVWLAAQAGDAASCAFNESVTLWLDGRLDPCALQHALDRLVARHEALRLRFAPTGETMTVLAPAPLPCPLLDLRGADADARHAALVDQDARTPFALDGGPLLRATLARLGDERHALLLTAHHIVCDGWSINVLVTELAAIYEAACAGRVADLPPALGFGDYALREQAQAAEAAGDLDWWCAQLTPPPLPLELPTDRPRAAIRVHDGHSISRRIDVERLRAVRKAGARHGSTLFATLLAAFEALAGRLGGAQDVVIGVPTAGQAALEDQILVGHCVQFLPMRGSWSATTTVAEHLGNTARHALEAFEHGRCTFGTLVRTLRQRAGLAHDPGRLPLTELQFNVERLADRMELPGLRLQVTPNPKAFVNFDLFLNVIEAPDGLRLDCDYNTALFDATTIRRWLDAFEALLDAFVADATQPLVRANVVPAAERVRQLQTFNATERPAYRGRTLTELVDARIAASPDAVAIVFRDQTQRYAELDARANRIAQLLQARSPAATGPVAVLVERGPDLIAALLAVARCGRPWLPLDGRHPPARLQAIVADAGISALITDDPLASAALAPGLPQLDLGADAAALAAQSAQRPAVSADPEALAYVICTSGSTGTPKGVEVRQGAVANLLLSMAEAPGYAAGDALLAVTTVAFDIAVLELFLPLICGGRVVIAEAEDVADGFQLLRLIERHGVRHCQATPSTWRLLLEAGFRAPPAFRMLCGGEALPAALAERLLADAAPDAELWNLYGPTETTIWSTVERVLPGATPISVGRPIANTRCLILDAEDQLVPIGVPGQLHLGGDGLARGYVGLPALTAERFIDDPTTPGARLYRSGDRARWLADGRIEHRGRLDDQTKLRGFRIELGEIESALVRHAGVPAAAVALRPDAQGQPRLVAFVVTAAGTPLQPERLHAALASVLPDYMIPTAWQALPALPLNANGKLDRRALPAADGAHRVEVPYRAPVTDAETMLCAIWAEVLGRDRIGLDDDLFQLGADSIQIFQIAARAHRAGLAYTARTMIAARTIGALAAATPPSAAETTAVKAVPSLAQFARRRRSGAEVE